MHAEDTHPARAAADDIGIATDRTPPNAGPSESNKGTAALDAIFACRARGIRVAGAVRVWFVAAFPHGAGLESVGRVVLVDPVLGAGVDVQGLCAVADGFGGVDVEGEAGGT